MVCYSQLLFFQALEHTLHFASVHVTHKSALSTLSLFFFKLTYLSWTFLCDIILQEYML